MDERTERVKRVERFFNWPVIVAALLVVPVLVVESAHVSHTIKTAAAIVNWGIWLVFAAEVVATLRVVPDRWHWIRTHPIDVVIVVLTPPWLPAGLQSLRALRLLRLLRLMKLAQLSRQVFSLDGLRYAAVLALLAVVGGGYAFSTIEEEKGLDTWDGIYWAFSQMTTVGSNISPTTNLGRVLAMALSVVGIGFVALLTGAIAERFLGPEVKAEIEEAEAEIDETEHELLDEMNDLAQRMGRLQGDVERLVRRN